MGAPRGTFEERFWRYVKKSEACWHWLGAGRTSGGVRHGIMYESPNKYSYAHRVSWRLHNGVIPGGQVVRHSCDLGTCVNPLHLLLGTQADNMADMRSRQRGAGNFTPDEVMVIRVAVAEGWASRAQVRDYFDAEKSTITKLISGKHWKHIPMPYSIKKGDNILEATPTAIHQDKKVSRSRGVPKRARKVDSGRSEVQGSAV